MRPAYSSFFVFYVNECKKQEIMVNCFIGIMSGCMLMKRGIISGKTTVTLLWTACRTVSEIGKASTEIINLQSILYLPKGTEHFLSDIHGEFKAFSHVLRNGSGAVRKKIDDVFGHTLSTADKMSLATLIYYPQKKIELVRQTEDDIENWYKITLYRLIEVCKTDLPNTPDPKCARRCRRIMRM